MYVAPSDPELNDTAFTVPYELNSDARISFFVHLFMTINRRILLLHHVFAIHNLHKNNVHGRRN